MRKATLLAAVLILCFASASLGFVMGGSNLDFMGYPKFDKRSPSKPYTRDQYAAQNYENETRAYLRAVDTYIENAKSDIERIREEIKEAARAADSAVNSYNNWARGGY